MPTLQDVAKLAGVSIATVSKVLSNTPYFTEETRDKVMRAVNELGYTPNLAARALSSGKTHIIGVVFPYIYDAIFADPLVLQILEGIEAACSGIGYNLLLSTPRLTAQGPDANFLQLVRSGYLDGMIAIDNVPLASVAAVSTERGIPTTVIGYASSRYYVRSDDYDGGRQLVRYVTGLGHRDIGIITVPDNMNYAVNERLRGVREGLNEVGITFDKRRVFFGDYSIPSGMLACQQLLEAYPDVTAILCMNDRMAIGAIQHLTAVGRHVPEDITVTGYDDIALASMFVPPLSTINQQASALGEIATRMLFDILDGRTPEPVIVPVELMVRSSSGRVRSHQPHKPD